MNKQLIRKAARYSLEAYKDDMDGAIKIESARTSTTAYIINHPRHQYVVFRGTQQTRDWLFNLTAFPWRYSGRWVHGGFMMAHRSVWRKIAAHLDPHKEIIFTGHSLGAALAELSAHCCRFLPHVSLIAFGKPNVFLRPSKAELGNLLDQISFNQSLSRISGH